MGGSHQSGRTTSSPEYFAPMPPANLDHASMTARRLGLVFTHVESTDVADPVGSKVSAPVRPIAHPEQPSCSGAPSMASMLSRGTEALREELTSVRPHAVVNSAASGVYQPSCGGASMTSSRGTEALQEEWPAIVRHLAALDAPLNGGYQSNSGPAATSLKDMQAAKALREGFFGQQSSGASGRSSMRPVVHMESSVTGVYQPSCGGLSLTSSRGAEGFQKEWPTMVRHLASQDVPISGDYPPNSLASGTSSKGTESLREGFIRQQSANVLGPASARPALHLESGVFGIYQPGSGGASVTSSRGTEGLQEEWPDIVRHLSAHDLRSSGGVQPSNGASATMSRGTDRMREEMFIQ